MVARVCNPSTLGVAAGGSQVGAQLWLLCVRPCFKTKKKHFFLWGLVDKDEDVPPRGSVNMRTWVRSHKSMEHGGRFQDSGLSLTHLPSYPAITDVSGLGRSQWCLHPRKG